MAEPFPSTRTYLVETYSGALDEGGLAALVSRAGDASTKLRATGAIVRHVRSYLVHEDEMCLHVFTGSSADVVLRASELAGIQAERIVETIDHASSPPSTSPRKETS